jgi:hypothetical protein
MATEVSVCHRKGENADSGGFKDRGSRIQERMEDTKIYNIIEYLPRVYWITGIFSITVYGESVKGMVGECNGLKKHAYQIVAVVDDDIRVIGRMRLGKMSVYLYNKHLADMYR